MAPTPAITATMTSCVRHRLGGEVGAGATAAHHPEDGQQNERPDQVELLLDGERPGVLERRGVRHRREVVRVGGDEMPVRHVPERRQGVAEEVGGAQRLGEEGGRGTHDGEHQEECRQEPAGPAPPERPQGDAPAALPFGQQERRDEVPGQNEEEIDAEVPADRPRRRSVEQDHTGDGERPDAVQGGEPAPGPGLSPGRAPCHSPQRPAPSPFPASPYYPLLRHRVPPHPGS